jgi:hypothetical protein
MGDLIQAAKKTLHRQSGVKRVNALAYMTAVHRGKP